VPVAEPETLRFLNFGAGIQSTALLLMACYRHRGFQIDHAIFADTGDETDEVYANIERSRIEAEKHGIGFHVVQKGVLSEDMEATGTNRIPVFIKKPDGKSGVTRRSCTHSYKIRPIRQRIREIIGVNARGRFPKNVKAIQVFGISTDETYRVKQSIETWCVYEYPLIGMGISRTQCIEYLKEENWPHITRSACVYCPYHSNSEWRKVWAIQKHRDKIIQIEKDAQRESGFEGTPFLHYSLKPIEEAMDNIGGDEDDKFFGMSNECAGVCDV
jgi:hypothetical protein